MNSACAFEEALREHTRLQLRVVGTEHLRELIAAVRTARACREDVSAQPAWLVAFHCLKIRLFVERWAALVSQ